MGPTWRITNELEFYEKAAKYIDNHVNAFSEKLKYLDNSNKKKESLLLAISKYNDIPKDCYKRIISDGLKIVLEDVEDWRMFSADVNTPLDEIILRQLISTKYNRDYVCSLFISSNYHITEEFIDDYIYISSQLFRFDEWDDIHVRAVSECAGSGIPTNKSKELIELYDKERLDNRPISIKIDLREINVDNKSDQFVYKYYKELNGHLYVKSAIKDRCSKCNMLYSLVK